MNIHMNLTAKGQALNAKIQAGNGTVPLEITRVVSAAGYSPTPLILNDVIDMKQTATIVRREIISFRAAIEITLTNQGNPSAGEPPLAVGYPLSQLGMYAIDPDEGEILYRISQFDKPNYVPVATEMGWTINPTWNFIVGNASDVIVNIDPSGLATVGQLNDHINEQAMSERGVHGIRFFEGCLQVWDGMEWINVEGSDPSIWGKDLSQAFAAEIAGFTSVWTWIQNRIQTGNFTGLFVGDFIPFTADGNNYKAEIAGINTYKNYGNTGVGDHIDFITRDCHPTAFVWNRADYNNGTAVSPNPWLASSLYARLNSLSMDTPSAAVADGTPTLEDFTSTGIFTTLPIELQNVIVQKRVLLPRRYMDGTLLIDDNSWDWRDIGLLWLPSEIEVYGCRQWGSNLSPNQGWSSGGFQQYPIFANNMRRVKGAGDGGDRTYWWLLSASGGLSTTVCVVYSTGSASHNTASDTIIRTPLCFRIA